MSKQFSKADEHGAHPGKWGVTLHEEGCPAKFVPASDKFQKIADDEFKRLLAKFDDDEEVAAARHATSLTKRRQKLEEDLREAAKKEREANEAKARAAASSRVD